jgi:hypothetical protein
MKHIFQLLIYLSLFTVPSFAQDWQKIVPLKTNCEELKKILGVEECEYPVSDYKFKEFNINITFSTKANGWNVSKDTVFMVLIFFDPAIKLKDFETDFSDYKIKPETDFPGLIYTNEKKGILFVTQNPEGDEEYVMSVTLFPVKTKRK